MIDETSIKFSINNSVASGLNSGCMKFYAFLDSDTLGTLNLILDHNVTLAANRPNQISEEIKHKRFDKLKNLYDSNVDENNKKYIR